MILFLDTSAFVKLLLREQYTDEVERWFEQATQLTASVVTYAEACSALCRDHRVNGTSSSNLEAKVASLDRIWTDVMALPVNERLAGRLALAHGLRGMDSVQLAAVSTLRDKLRADAPDVVVSFASFDHRLLTAAEREDLTTLGGALE